MTFKILGLLFLFLIMINSLQGQKLNPLRTKLEKERVSFEKITHKTIVSLDSIANLIAKKNDTIENMMDSNKKIEIGQDLTQLENEFNRMTNYLILLEFDFIKANPSSPLSLERLKFRFSRPEGIVYSDTIIKLFNGLSKYVRNSKDGKKLVSTFLQFKNSQVGSIAPDFECHDINDQKILLSSFRNRKYVLLDFWSSSCSPCREEMPFLKDLYKKYNEGGFEIIGIALDYDSARWKDAVKKDGTQIWKHISVKKGADKFSDMILDDYFVHGIPVKILVNKQGVIIGRWNDFNKDNDEEISKMLSEIFN